MNRYSLVERLPLGWRKPAILKALYKVRRLDTDGPWSPGLDLIFNALELVPSPELCKVVLLGNEPDSRNSQGLCMEASIKDGIALAKQGVLMLNVRFSVARNKPGTHHNKLWEQFTKELLDNLPQDVLLITFGTKAEECTRTYIRSPYKWSYSHPYSLKSSARLPIPQWDVDVADRANALLTKLGKSTISWGIIHERQFRRASKEERRSKEDLWLALEG